MIKENNQNECEHNEKSNRMGYYSPTGNDWALTGGGWINPPPDYSSYDLRSQQHLYPTDVADRRLYKIEIYDSEFKWATSSKWCLSLIFLLCCCKPKGSEAHVHVQAVSAAVCARVYLHGERVRVGPRALSLFARVTYAISMEMEDCGSHKFTHSPFFWLCSIRRVHN